MCTGHHSPQSLNLRIDNSGSPPHKGLVINYGEGGGLQNGKIAGPKLFAPSPQDRVKLFMPPFLNSGNFSCPPYNMAKTSSY